MCASFHCFLPLLYSLTIYERETETRERERRGRKRGRREREPIFPNSHQCAEAEAGSQDSNLVGESTTWAITCSPHLHPSVCITGSCNQKQELSIKPRHWNMKHRHLNCSVKCSSLFHCFKLSTLMKMTLFLTCFSVAIISLILLFIFRSTVER